MYGPFGGCRAQILFFRNALSWASFNPLRRQDEFWVRIENFSGSRELCKFLCKTRPNSKRILVNFRAATGYIVRYPQGQANALHQ